MVKEWQSVTSYFARLREVHTKQALDMWTELGRTGLTFWGKRNELEKSLREDPET
jgi:hypothetical protein